MILINLGHKKNVIQKKNENDHQVKLSFRILRALGSWYFNVGIMVLLFISSSILYLLFFIFNRPIDCNNDTAAFIVYAICLYITIFFFIGLMIYDFVLNWINVGNCNLFTIWKDDIFFFRTEIYIFGILLVFPLFFIVSLYFLLTQNIPVFTFSAQPIIGGFLNTILNFSFFFTLSLFPLLVTLFYFIRNLLKKPVKQDEIYEFLNDPKGYEIFFNFSKAEFSIENISCWNDIKQYNNENDTLKKKSIAKNIYEKYLTNSELEVNVPKRICTEVKEKIETQEVAKNLFNDLETNIMINISDTWSRLCFTKEFLEYDLQRKFIKSSF